MRSRISTTKNVKSAGPSPLRLRFGVLLILLWLLPFWALAPYIAHSLKGLSNPPSVAAVTTAIVVVQTILGLLGLLIAGAEVKAIIKSSGKLVPALRAIWPILIHGEIRHESDGSAGSNKEPRSS
jgi:hypothetical protein